AAYVRYDSCLARRSLSKQAPLVWNHIFAPTHTWLMLYLPMYHATKPLITNGWPRNPVRVHPAGDQTVLMCYRPAVDERNMVGFHIVASRELGVPIVLCA